MIPTMTAAIRITMNKMSHTPKLTEIYELRFRLRSMPLVSADAESASAMRITLRAIGTVCISIYSGKAFTFCIAEENAPLVSMD